MRRVLVGTSPFTRSAARAPVPPIATIFMNCSLHFRTVFSNVRVVLAKTEQPSVL